MKKLSFIIPLFAVSFSSNAQISGIPATPPAPQAVQPASRSEKSAAPQKQNVPVQANPVPPVYPGAEPVPVVIPRELVYPAAPPAPTQPPQTQPLTPVESTNQLQPARPQPDQGSRNNAVNGRPSSAIQDNRVNKNELRAAGTTEQKQLINNSTLIYPARTDSVKKVVTAPVRKKRKASSN